MRTNTIVTRKIQVPDFDLHLTRERLHDRFRESLVTCSTTIVSGRAGVGKTVFAADEARRSIRPVAWYKVDASDADLRVFINYLAASIRRHFPFFWLNTEESSPDSADLDPTLMADSFVYDLLMHLTGPLLIVIDDLHHVYDEPWVVPFFSRLLPLVPQEAHVVLTGRGLPPTPLWRMRSKQTLSVIDEAELAFSESEARQLFELYGLSSASAHTALSKSLGRAALLAALAREASAAQHGTISQTPLPERSLRRGII